MNVIVDYKAGNVGSIKNMLKRVGYDCTITNDIAIIERASKLILPGIGNFDYCVNQLMDSGLIPTITKKVFEDKIPILGICVGCQMLTESSEEGVANGLGWIKGKTVKFKFDISHNYTLPHMGWTDVVPSRDSLLLKNIYPDARFYFAHSYHLVPDKEDNVILNCQYGYRFAAAVQQGHIYGVQFHPEKSHKFGMQILENFIKFC
jgi:imidazole glycerol-phosphate synthase subunit HisH